MFRFRKTSVSTKLDSLSDSPESIGGGVQSRHSERGSGQIGQGDSVSESRFSALPKDDQSERCSLSIRAGGIEQDTLSQANRRGSASSITSGAGGLQQHQLQGVSDLCSGSGNGLQGKILLDRKRKERHESTSQGQEKKVIRSASDDESLVESEQNGDFRRTLSHDSFNPKKDQNQLSGFPVEMRKPIAQDLVELTKKQSEGELTSKDSISAANHTENYYGGAEPQFDVMRKITTSENYEAELQRQLERSANWSASPPTVKKSHKRRHRSSKRDAKAALEIQVNSEDCAEEEEMLSPASGSSESVEEMGTEQNNVPSVKVEEAEDMASQTSDRLMALDVSSKQQQQQQSHQNNMEQRSNVISIRAILGGTSADSEVLLSPRNSVLGKEGIDIPPSPPLHQAPMDPPISRQSFLEGNPVTKMNELARQITALKRQLKSLESEYEQVYGYKPSHSDKLNHKEIRKCVLQLTKTKKELKQIREDPSCLHMSCLSGVSGNILSVNRGNSIPPTKGTPEYAKYLEATVKEIEKTLSDKRRASGRPDELELMSPMELQDEKCVMQRQLLVLEKRHGRPSSKAEKDIVRPLYERYRAIKRFSVKVVCVRETSIDLAPIMEHEPLEFCETANEPISRTVVANEVWTSGDRRHLQVNADEDEKEESFNEMTLGELEARLKQAKDEKRRMRAAIRKFETDFQNVAGRPPQKDEKYSSSEMELAYQKYKRTKATVRLLDVLISKRRVPSLITDTRKN